MVRPAYNNGMQTQSHQLGRNWDETIMLAWMRRSVVDVAGSASRGGGLQTRSRSQLRPRLPPAVVYLDSSRDWQVHTYGSTRVCLLAREIVRQAILIAARDELGLATRDAWLGDSLPPQGDATRWDVAATPGDPSIVEILRGPPGNPIKAGRHELRLPLKAAPDYRALAVEMERLSRTKFADMFKQAGLQGKPHSRNDSARVPRGIGKLLDEMNFLSQFRALRELHEAVNAEGQSPALLGALARGYANLGVMTEFHWHPAHKVFKARALLYAQRMVAADEKSVLAKWHRAYVEAMAGLHAAALADLDEADKAFQAIAEKDRPPRPEWVECAGLLCRCDVDALGRLVNEPKVGELAALCRYLAVEQAGGSSWAVQTAIRTLDVIPECYRVHDGLCNYGGVSVLHAATQAGPAILAESLYKRLAAMPQLPAEVRRIVKKQEPGGLLGSLVPGSGPARGKAEYKIRVQLIAALLRAGGGPASPAAAQAASPSGEPAAKPEEQPKRPAEPDHGEPSWATLGRMLRELAFVQVWRRTDFQRYRLSVPPDEFLAATAILVAEHPYRHFLEWHSGDVDKSREALARLAKADPAGSEIFAHHLNDAFASSDPATRMKFYMVARADADATVRDVVTDLPYYRDKPGLTREMARHLLEISPFSPLARAKLVEHDWKAIQPQLPEWEKTAAAYPVLWPHWRIAT